MNDPIRTAQERLATSFGYRDVRAEEKAGEVRAVFDRVAERYDLMNDLMSLGVHRLWKRALVDALAPRPGLTLLDMAGGTGDLAFRVLKRLGATPEPEASSPSHRVIVADINQSMLEVGRERALDLGLTSGLDWLCSDAEALPLPDRLFDAYTIGFGIRNVTHLDRALREARRVLKPGGRFLCLEFSEVRLPPLVPLYDIYSFAVLPWLGANVAGDRESYQYLAESIRRFPAQDDFAAMIAEAGFGRVRYRNLSGGIAALHSAWRT